MSSSNIGERDEFESMAEFYNGKLVSDVDRLIEVAKIFRDNRAYANYLRLQHRFEDIQLSVISRGSFRAHSASARAGGRHLADHEPQPEAAPQHV